MVKIKAHKQNTCDFADLTYIQQARSINADILNLEAAIKAHVKRSIAEKKTNPKDKRIKNLKDLILRLEKI